MKFYVMVLIGFHEGSLSQGSFRFHEGFIEGSRFYTGLTGACKGCSSIFAGGGGAV